MVAITRDVYSLSTSDKALNSSLSSGGLSNSLFVIIYPMMMPSIMNIKARELPRQASGSNLSYFPL